jgi:RHS repeat-associated protein
MGNITALVNPEQSIVAKYLYDPYGGLLAQSGPLADFNSQRFSSKEHLKDAGLYQFGYRLYDPSLQRWLTRDPLGEVVGGYNLYAFAGNSPTRLLDAFGLDDSTGDPDLDARTSDPLPTPLSPYLPCIETAPWAEGLGYMGDALTDPDKWTDALEAIPTLPTLAIASGIHAAQGEFGDALFDAVGAALGLLGGSGGSAGAGMADDVAAAAGRMATTEAAESGLSAAARSAEGAAVASKVAEKGGLNLFRSGQEGLATRGAATGWKDGDRMFHLPNQGSPKANWKQNSGRLREEMGRGEPIFDSFRDPSTGLQIPSGLTPGSGGRFLNAERKLLESRGWKYSPSTGAYHPPSP